MLEGGGTLVLASHQRWRGPGHNSVLQTKSADYMAHHTYDAEHLDAKRILQIRPMYWGRDGWPVVGEPLLQTPRERTAPLTQADIAGVWRHSVNYNDETANDIRLLPSGRPNRGLLCLCRR